MKIWQPLTADCTLFRSSAFQLTVLIFGLIAVFYAGISFKESEAPESGLLTKAYISYLYLNLSKPALIVGLSLPLLGLIASHLRSIQTINQIETQEKQNTFSNYSKHREFFFEFFKDEQLFTKESSLAIKAYELYALLYPNAKEGELEPMTTAIPALEKLRCAALDIYAEAWNVYWRTETTPPDLQKAVDQHVQVLTEHLQMQERFFQPGSRLADISERITRLRVTHDDLFTASNFYTYNDCSMLFDRLADVMKVADEHLRDVLKQQNILAQLFDTPENSTSIPFANSDFVRNGLVEFLSSGVDDKLGYIENRLMEHPQRHGIMKVLRSLADEAKN